ncbi:uncharacterized [Tachysurus ichikawai]
MDLLLDLSSSALASLGCWAITSRPSPSLKSSVNNFPKRLSLAGRTATQVLVWAFNPGELLSLRRSQDAAPNEKTRAGAGPAEQDASSDSLGQTMPASPATMGDNKAIYMGVSGWETSTSGL